MPTPQSSNPANDIVDVKGLTKRFGNSIAVDGISFTVGQGSVTGLLGGNGAGKTTTIAMIMGLVLPTSGRIQVLGHAMGGPHVPHDAMYALHRFMKWVVDEAPPASTPAFLQPVAPRAQVEPAE